MGAVAKQTRGEELGRGMMVLSELSMRGRLHSIVTNVDLALHNGRQFSIPCIEHGEGKARFVERKQWALSPPEM